jgi:TetR/AcrR family transcriptional repressor of nem operon
MTTLTRDTRQTILAAAADLFRSQGYGATTMQVVAERAGISKGNLTYHFPSKQALFEAVYDEAYRYVRERVLARSFEEEPDAISALEAFTLRLRRWLIDPQGRFVGCIFTNIAVETQHSDAEVGRLAREALVGIREALAERFEAGQATGSIRADAPAAELARMWFWMYEGALALSKAMDDPAEYDAFRERLRAWLRPPR